MGYIVSFILLCVGVSEYLKIKTWVAPSVLFCFIWMLVSFFASLRLFNLIDVGMKTWVIVLLGVLSFVLGTKIRLKTRKSNCDEISRICVNNSYISTRAYRLLLIIVGLYFAGQLVQTISLLMKKIPLSTIREASFGFIQLEGYTYNADFLASFARTVFSALATLLIAIGVEKFFRERKWKYIMASLYLVIGVAISAGGRWIIAYFLIEFFVCKNIIKIQNKMERVLPKKKRTAIMAAVPLVVMVIAFVRITSQRVYGKNIDLVSNLYAYFCGCIPFFDLKMADIDQSGVWSIIYAGMYGFWSFIIPILQNITGFSFPLFSETKKFVMTAQEGRNIGTMGYNAFVTCFYYLYADLRYAGVIVGMLVFGVVSGNLFLRAKSEKNSKNIIPYMVVSQLLIKSIQSYAFQSADYVFVFIIMFIIYIAKSYRFRVR